MEQAYSIVMLLKVIFFFFLLFCFLPTITINFEEESNSSIDKFFISLIHTTIIIIYVVHFLAFIKLYETISLLVIMIVIYLGVVSYKGGKPAGLADMLGMRIIVEILDMSEGKYGLAKGLETKCKNWLNKTRVGLKHSIKSWLYNPFSGFLLTAAIGAAAYVRFKHSLEHLYLGASDSYLHLVWSKYLAGNDIYHDGIYPYGYEAIIAALNKLFFIDSYYVTRFIGPLGGLLMVLSLYYVLKKNYKNIHIAWMAVVIYGIVIDSQLPSDVWRQMHALPMEYAAIFLLPGLHFFHMYYKHAKQKYLFLAAECVAITLLIHPYVTVFLGLGYLVIFVLNIRKITSFRKLGLIISVMAGSISLGILPMIIGMLLGMEFHGSLGYIQRSVSLAENSGSVSSLFQFNETNPSFLILFVCIAVLIVVRLIKFIRKGYQKDSGENMFSFTIILTALVYYVMYRSTKLGLPVLMDPARVGIFLSMLAVAVYGIALSVVDSLSGNIKDRYILNTIVCVLVVGMVLNFTPMKIPKGEQYQYDDTVQAYLDIKRDYPLFSWTIISPVEEYQLVLGYGWHYEIWEFVRNISSQGGTELKIPTDNVFLFVEKIPLKSGISIEDVDMGRALPEISGDVSNDYYLNVDNRALIQAKAYSWAEEYMKEHKNMKIYRETDNIRVYLLVQDNKNPGNLLQ